MSLEGKITLIARLEIDKTLITFPRLVERISDLGGDMVALDIIVPGKQLEVRDLTVSVNDAGDSDTLQGGLNDTLGIRVIHISDRTFLYHLGGKIGMHSKVAVKNRDDLAMVYTPGVARVCKAIHEDESKAFSLTIRRNMVAVVSDGSAVLGLGNIGPYAAMPVMEGKAMLFKQLADVDAFPICLQTQDTDEIIRIVKGIAPAFGGINLEDIAAPRCFEIEERLKQELDIPVFHDDQHGTAVVILAGLINALKLVNKRIEQIRVVVCGIGAAGMAATKILLSAGVRNIIGVDKTGILHTGIRYENEAWNQYARMTNPGSKTGGLREAIRDCDVFIGVSRPGVLSREDIELMAPNPIVFAMANPTPEIMPEEAGPIVRIMATGRSDYPNQLNNLLAYPGIFRGALDCRATDITEQMKTAAAHAIASVVTESELNEHYIIPSVFNDAVVKRVRAAVVETAVATGVARKVPRDYREKAALQTIK